MGPGILSQGSRGPFLSNDSLVCEVSKSPMRPPNRGTGQGFAAAPLPYFFPSIAVMRWLRVGWEYSSATSSGSGARSAKLLRARVLRALTSAPP